jgi:hypothetical protein
LRTRKADLTDIVVEVNCILIGDTRERMQEFADFWSTRVDAMHFHAEYYDVLRFRNLFFVPESATIVTSSYTFCRLVRLRPVAR